MKLYSTLAPWYRLLTPLEDYAEEAAVFRGLLLEVLGPPPAGERWRLLELGAGAGHNAHYLSDTFALTLTDRSAEMLALAAEVCPGARLLVGDMRDLRLEERFDAVFVHDAVSYLVTEEEVRAMLATARAHLRPGGALLVCPDYVEESFEPEEEIDGGEDGARALRCLSWVFRAPGVPGYLVDHVFVLREGLEPPTVVQERHHEGLHARAAWVRMIEEAGFRWAGPRAWRAEGVARDLEVFLARAREA